MTSLRAELADLLEPLFAGLVRAHTRHLFLQNLAAKMAADYCGIRLQGPGGAQMYRWNQTADRGAQATSARDQLRTIAAPAGIRPLQVYHYRQLLSLSSADAGLTQHLFEKAEIADGIWMQVPTTKGWFASIMLERSTQAFSVHDRDMLATLGPYISIALDILGELEDRLRRAEMAEETLRGLGVSQALIGTDGRVVVADPSHLGDLDAHQGALLLLPTGRTAELAHQVERMAAGAASEAVFSNGARPDLDLLLRPNPNSSAIISVPEAAIAVTRKNRPISATSMTAALQSLYGLSHREAQIAAALARGEELVPAGRAIGLSPETTRKYSKQLYAKTGTRGQADLVRLVLSGLAPLVSSTDG